MLLCTESSCTEKRAPAAFHPKRGESKRGDSTENRYSSKADSGISVRPVCRTASFGRTWMRPSFSIVGILLLVVFSCLAGAAGETAIPDSAATGVTAQQSAPSPATLAPSNLVGNPAGRSQVNLDGAWRAIVDPYENGLRGRFFENAKPKDKQDLVEYDFDASGTLKVPGDWNSQREELFFYEGPVWYKTSFAYHRAERRRVFLYFGAANYRARVYLNGELVGEHEGGFTPFNFEVSSKIRDGENLLVVEVNDQRHKEDVPTVMTDFWNYGGITREVSVVDVPETFIQDYFVQLARGSGDEISGWVQLNGPSASQQILLEIPEAHVRQAITTDAQGRGTFRFSAQLERWSPENPKLYSVKLSGGSDTVTDQIGFRS